jgi:hypothetical protein
MKKAKNKCALVVSSSYRQPASSGQWARCKDCCEQVLGEGKEDKCGGQGQLFPNRGPSKKREEEGSFYQVTTTL